MTQLTQQTTSDQHEANVSQGRSQQQHPDLFAVDDELQFPNESVPDEFLEERASLNRRLVAPIGEIRQRHRQSRMRQSNTNNEDLVRTLRVKQLALADIQMDVQKVLLENAKIAQEECIEKLRLSRALRMQAEANIISNDH